MYQRWPKRDPNKHYYLVPTKSSISTLLLTRSPSTITCCAARIAEPTSATPAMEDRRALRDYVTDEVKRTNGQIKFEDAQDIQRQLPMDDGGGL